jgi:hypothetical protein
MDKYLFRRIITVVVLFTMIIFGFIWFIRKINTKPSAPAAPKAVLSEIANSPKEVKFVTQGRIVGNETYREIRITVTRSSRVLEVVEGYENTVTSRTVFPNNENAFHTFLSALSDAGFTSSKVYRGGLAPQGTCPTGKRYWYQIIDGVTFQQSLWGNSCNASGTFNGRKSTISWLFQNQIPDYNNLIKGVKL